MAFQQLILDRFKRMGARATIRPLVETSRRQSRTPMTIDVVRGEDGEHFDIHAAADVRLEVVDIQPQRRHLLLVASSNPGRDQFLCGHDEFHWFVAAMPLQPHVETVRDAQQALKPRLVERIERRKRCGKHRRRSDVFLRQGEWFFIPWPHAGVDADRVIENGVLRRGPGSQPHVCGFMFLDGEREYECDRYPKLAFFETEYQQILRTRRKAHRWNWRPLPFRPDFYVKGWITHADHSPLYLDIWHRVEQNQEGERLSMSRMIYRD